MSGQTIRSNPYAVHDRPRRVTDQASVVHDGAMVLLSTRDGMSGASGPATLSARQAVDYACAIIRVADPETAALLVQCIEGNAVDYPDEDAEDRDMITQMTHLVKLLGGNAR